mmetsp:Transcript_28740/g.65085  ORF Transcript_28740/g.65085 Transcript_28740/m.65085 type:complete len:82 (-) Transcript_28740:87-332(-)
MYPRTRHLAAEGTALQGAGTPVHVGVSMPWSVPHRRMCHAGGCAPLCKDTRREQGSAAATDAAVDSAVAEWEWQCGGRERW